MRASMLIAASVVLIMGTAALAQSPAPPAPAAPTSATKAQNCKDIVSAKARSAAQLSDASRERRARENAIDNWRRRVRDTYGWRYRFWSRAQEKQINCGGGASAKHCTVSARPCRLF